MTDDHFTILLQQCSELLFRSGTKPGFRFWLMSAQVVILPPAFNSIAIAYLSKKRGIVRFGVLL